MQLKRTAVAALAIAITTPAAAGAQQDLRNPDQRGPAAPREPASQYQDLRNADQRGPAAPRESSSPAQDLRNADQRAPAPAGASPVQVIEVPSVQVVKVPEGGFDWGDAGIGAAGGLAILTLAGGAGALVLQRRRSHRLPVAAR